MLQVTAGVLGVDVILEAWFGDFEASSESHLPCKVYAMPSIMTI